MILLTILLSAMYILAQSTTGKIIGTVSAVDGVVPGATVVVVDDQTKKERTVTASNEGTFEVPQLDFGTYTVTITASGFKTFTATKLKVDAGRDYPLSVQLEVGQVSETVTVTADAQQINASNAELSTTVSPQQIKELPLNGRNPLSLLNLQAGVNATSGSINGQRTSSVNYTRDGLNVQDNFIRNGFVSDTPTVDDTGEFNVITQNAGADQGQGGSTQVQLVTPRGGSNFHGALYEFNRNSRFTANSFLNNSSGIAKTFLNRNQFGGSFSGPLPLPHFGEGGPAILKNHAFFFVNYEGFRLATQATITGLTTLLPAAQGGNFSYIGTDGVTRTVNVLTGAGLNLTGANATTFANAGGALTVDPIIQSRFLSRLPSSGNNTTFTGLNYLQGYDLNRSKPTVKDAVTARVDVNVNDRNSFNFVFKRNTITDARTDVAAGFLPGTVVSQGGPTTLFRGEYTSTFSNRFANTVRAGFQLSKPFFLSTTPTATNYLIGGLPFTQPENTFQNQGRDTVYKTLQDNAVYTFGNHSLRFGGGVDSYDIRATNFASVTPTFNITTTSNAQTPGLTIGLFPGAASADVARANTLRYTLAGIIGSGSVGANLVDLKTGFVAGAPSIRKLQFKIYSGYVTDSYRYRPNITLNLGLRYDLYTPLHDPIGLYLEPQLNNPSNPVADVVNPNGNYVLVGTNAGKKGDFFKPDKNNFGPNFSFAYSPKFENGIFSKLVPNSTVIRGGFRISYVNDEYVRSADNAELNNAGLGSQTVSAFRAGTTSTALRSTLSPSAGFATLPTFANPSVPTLPRPYAANNAGFGGVVSLIDPNLQNQKLYEYNIGIQREIGFKTVLEVRYVGNKSNQLVRSIDYNQVRIRESGLLADFGRAQSNCRLQAISLYGAASFTDGTNPVFYCSSAAYNPAIAGSQQLTYFPTLGSYGGIVNGGIGATGSATSNATVLQYLAYGIPGDLAYSIYAANNVTNARNTLLANPNAAVANYTTNGGKLRYNSGQIELRRRFSDGFSLQGNYTFQKTLTNIPTSESDQTRVSAFLDNSNQGLDYARPQYDRTHTFNFNGILELPFGRGKKFLNGGGVTDKIFGGIQFTSIVTLSSGIPLSVIDNDGNLNRSGRSTYQSATTNLSGQALKDLFGIFRTPNGIYFINPKVLYATGSNGQRVDLTQPLPNGVRITGVTAAGDPSQAPFSGQVFFYNQAGSTGNIQRNFINGPRYINWDAGISKRVKFTETTSLQLRMEAFNVLNNANFFPDSVTNIFNVNNTTNFGRLNTGYAPRIIQFGARFDF